MKAIIFDILSIETFSYKPKQSIVMTSFADMLLSELTNWARQTNSTKTDVVVERLFDHVRSGHFSPLLRLQHVHCMEPDTEKKEYD